MRIHSMCTAIFIQGGAQQRICLKASNTRSCPERTMPTTMPNTPRIALQNPTLPNMGTEVKLLNVLKMKGRNYPARWVVAPGVVGSNPIAHPPRTNCLYPLRSSLLVWICLDRVDGLHSCRVRGLKLSDRCRQAVKGDSQTTRTRRGLASYAWRGQ